MPTAVRSNSIGIILPSCLRCMHAPPELHEFHACIANEQRARCHPVAEPLWAAPSSFLTPPPARTESGPGLWGAGAKSLTRTTPENAERTLDSTSPYSQ